MPRPLELLLTPLGWALRGRRSGVVHGLDKRAGWSAPAGIRVTTTSFPAGGVIPDRHSALGRGANLSPALAWEGVPAAAAELVVIVEDIDFPFDRPGIHTIGLLPAAATGALAEGELAAENTAIRWIPVPGLGGARTGYAGPRPLPGHGPHHYRFWILALDAPVPPLASADAAAEVPALVGLDAIEPFVSGHVLAAGFVEGSQRG